MTVSSVQPGVKIRVLPRIPAQLVDGTGIAITRANGIWTVALDFAELTQVVSVPTPDTTWVALYDSAGTSYARISISDLFATVVSSFWSGSTVVEKTTPDEYTMLDTDDFILINKTVGQATTVDLVTAVGRVRPVKIVDLKGDSGTNPITIDPAGAETVIGLSTYTINNAYGSITLWPRPDGTGWYV